MSTKSVQLSMLFAMILVFFLLLLPVSADQGDQEVSSSPTPTLTPAPNSQELQSTLLVPDARALSVDQTHALSEVVELRTATSKHYQLGPNLYRAYISVIPIHYKDARGNWQEIDTRPVAGPAGGFKVEASDVKMVFPGKLGQTGLEVNATIYPSPPEKIQPLGSERVKPGLAGISIGSSTAKQSEQKGSSVQLPLQWQPQYLVYASDAGPVSSFLRVSEAAAKTVGNGVEYAQAFANVSLTFRPSAIGFVQQLHFDALPFEAGAALDKSATKLEYTVHVGLPSDIQLYSYGVPQTNNFTTDRLELRDQAGDSLMVLPAPRLLDQVASRNLPHTQYRVERLADGISLIAVLPLDWLTDPARQYPVIAEIPVIVQSNIFMSFDAMQDTWIWQCNPSANYGSDTIMYAGKFGCSGAGAERALVQWVIDSLPPNAVMVDPTESQLWRLPLYDVGGDVQISTHRMFTSWAFDGATWLNQTSTGAWSQPGAENNYLVAPEDIVDIPSGGSEDYISMGSLASLVGAWHTDQYFYPWGDTNYGVIYKSTSTSATDLDRAFAQIAYAPDSGPRLSVTYADPPLSAFINPLAPDVDYYTPRAPSPDYYQINNVPAKWRAFGIRPVDGRSDYDLLLSSSTSFTSSVEAGSFEVGSIPDFVVVNPDVSATLYPWAIQWEGTGLYYLKYATQSGSLMLGGTTLINGTASTFFVLDVYRVNMTAGKGYQIALNVTSGNADLGLALFAPTAAGGSDFMTRDAAIALSDSASFGGNEEVVYDAAESGWYGLVVWNNGGTQDSNYQLSLQSKRINLYLPVIFKNFEPAAPPLTNGGFETGSLNPWSGAGPGGPMVARVVANPSPGCFSGSFAARLGTPGKLPDNTIPVGEVSFEQRFHVPPGSSQLIFNYWVYSYDIIQGSTTNRYYDRFEVAIDGAPVLSSGNPAGTTNGQTLWQSGCQTKSINISSFAGKNMTLKFSVYNLVFPSYNTWAFVDNVRVQ
jgi:hypothetical protein